MKHKGCLELTRCRNEVDVDTGAPSPQVQDLAHNSWKSISP